MGAECRFCPCEGGEVRLNRHRTRPVGIVVVLLAAAFMVLSVGTHAVAQTNTGEVGGVVRDVSGGALAGATVTARQAATGVVVERVTDAAGRFFLPALRPGEWDITASLSGFAPQTHKGIVLELGRTLNVDFRLGVEGVTESVTVGVTAALLQTTTAEISDVIDNRQVVQFPLNGRNFLAPGAAQQRRRHSARRHARRCAPAGGSAAQRRRTAIGPQHLPAGRRQGHRRALQQPGDQSIGRLDPGVQDPEVDVPGGVRREGVGADQRRHQGRRQRHARQPVRVPSQRHLRRAQLLRLERRAGAAAPAESVRRRAGRSPRAETAASSS